MSTLFEQARRVPRFAEAAVERARLTVVPRARARRAGRVPFVALVSLLLMGGVAGLLFLNTSMQQTSFTATALERRAQLLDAQRQALQLRLETLQDPQHLAAAAAGMGMVPPAAPVFLRLGSGRVLGDPVPATAATTFPLTALPTRKPRSLDPPPVIVPAPAAQVPGRSGAARPAQGATTGTKKTPAPPTAGRATRTKPTSTQHSTTQHSTTQGSNH
jgi:hypothetical protein